MLGSSIGINCANRPIRHHQTASIVKKCRFRPQSLRPKVQLLTPQPELADNILVAGRIGPFKISQQFFALSHHL